MKSKKVFLILGILVIAIAIRFFYLLLEVEVDWIYRDYRILHEQMGEWAVEKFFAGEGGAFTVALGGVISFFRGPSLLNTRLASLVFFSFFILSVYFLGREVCNSKAGLVSMLFIAIGTPFFTFWNIAGRGGVMDVLLLGNILLILGVRLRKRLDHNSQLFLAGIIAGLGFLAGRFLIFYYIFGFILFVVPHYRRKFTKPGIITKNLAHLRCEHVGVGWPQGPPLRDVPTLGRPQGSPLREKGNSYIINLFLCLLGFVLASSPFWIYHFPEYWQVLGLSLNAVKLPHLHNLPCVFGLIPFKGLYSYPVLLIYIFSFLYYLQLVFRLVYRHYSWIGGTFLSRILIGVRKSRLFKKGISCINKLASIWQEFVGVRFIEPAWNQWSLRALAKQSRDCFVAPLLAMTARLSNAAPTIEGKASETARVAHTDTNWESVHTLKQLFFLFLLILIVSCISGESSWKMLPIFSVFPILLSYAVLRVPKIFSNILILLILIGNGHGLISAYQFRQVPQVVKINKQEYGLGELLSFLKREKIRAVYANASVSFRLMSRTRREIVSSEPWLGISPHYTQIVDAKNRFAYIFKGERDTEKFAVSLYLAGGEYEREEIHPGFTVFHSFSPPQPGIESARTGWSAVSDHNEDALSNAFDGIASTRWTTGRPQRPGMFFLLDMGKVEKVNRISLLCSTERDCPKYFTLLTSIDGIEWSEVVSVDKRYFPGLHWSGRHLFWEKRTGNLDIHFRALDARYLKIVLKSFCSHFYWSINEMFVYRPAEGIELSEGQIMKLGEQLISDGVLRVYGPEWLMAKLAVSSGGKLKTLWRYNRKNVYSEFLKPQVPFSRNVHFGDSTRFILDKRRISVLKDFVRVTKVEDISGCGVYSMSGYGMELAPQGWKADSNCRQEEAAFAFDRNWLTRWSSGKLQEPGIYYQLNLGRVQNITGIVLDFSGSPYDYQTGFRLLSSLNGRDWEEAETEVKFVPGYLWTGEHFLKASGEMSEMQISFEPLRARSIKIVLTESSPAYHWSIYEIHVYTNRFL